MLQSARVEREDRRSSNNEAVILFNENNRMNYCPTQNIYMSKVQLPVPVVPVSWSAVVV